MTSGQLLWSLLLLAVTTVLIALPFWPAWAEWRRPRDLSPWPLPPEVLQTCRADSHALKERVRVPSGASFGQLQARHIQLGHGTPAPAQPLPGLVQWQAPAGARPWGQRGWHLPRRLQIAAGRHVPGSLVVQGPLDVQSACLIDGDLKARGPLQLGAHCRVLGNVFGERDIALGPGCRVLGLVMAEGRLQLASGVVIGSPQQPVSVCADQIDVQGPVQIHGTVHARIQGHVARKAPPDTSHNPPSAQENNA